MEKETLKKGMDLYSSIEILKEKEQRLKNRIALIKGELEANETESIDRIDVSLPADIAISAMEVYHKRVKGDLQKLEQELKEL